MAAQPKKWEHIVDKCTKSLAEHEKSRIEAIVLKEKRQYNAALVRVNKGLKIVSSQLAKINNDKSSNQFQPLAMSQARLYFELSHIHFFLKKYSKAIAHGEQAIEASKDALFLSNYETLKWKEIVALSYRNLELWKESLNMYNQILYCLDSIILGLSNNSNSNNATTHTQSSNQSLSNTNNNPKLGEMQRWKATIVYEIGMAYNNLQQFKEAEIMARKALELNTNYHSGDEMQILSKILLAVIISNPHTAKYEESLDTLKSAKQDVKSKIDALNASSNGSDATSNSSAIDCDEKETKQKNDNANISRGLKNLNLKEAMAKKEIEIKWNPHLQHINNLMNRIIPLYIKSIKQSKGPITNKLKSGTNRTKNTNQKNKKRNNKNKNNKKNKHNQNINKNNQNTTSNQSNSEFPNETIDENLEMVD